MFVKHIRKVVFGSVIKNIVDIDENKNSLIIKQWFFSKFLLRHLRKNGFNDFEKVFVEENGIHFVHKVYGEFLVIPDDIIFKENESTINFEVELVHDKLKGKLIQSMLFPALQCIAGGVIIACSSGFAGTGLLASGLVLGVNANQEYAKNKTGCLGHQTYNLPAIASIDKSGKFADFLKQNDGVLTFRLTTSEESISIKVPTSARVFLTGAKDNFEKLVTEYKEYYD